MHRLAINCGFAAFMIYASLLWSKPATAQTPRGQASPSIDAPPPNVTPGEALTWGILFPGAGQYYLDENRHGAAITAKSLALIGAGTLTLAIDNCFLHFADEGQCVPHRHFGQVAIGSLLIGAGAWVWGRGALEAWDHARGRNNKVAQIISYTRMHPVLDASVTNDVRVGVAMNVLVR
jgi:hypothetical protein